MAKGTCRYCGVAIVGRQRTKCAAIECLRAYNNERTARFNAKWKAEHGARFGSKYKSGRPIKRERTCESCGKTYRTSRPTGRVCSLSCWWFINPQTIKRSPLDWHQCRGCEHWIATPGRAWCSKRCRCGQRPPPKGIARRFVYGPCRHCGGPFLALNFGGPLPQFCSQHCSKTEQRDRYRATKREAYVSPVSRLRIFERDGWRCQICRRLVKRGAVVPHPKAPVVDHIIPLAMGGTHEERNAQTAHYLCNSIKAAGGTDQLLLFG